tara:strand:+ start:93 stop:347 length:255 start_codon:yes stop_codon:yes gene_type:complete
MTKYEIQQTPFPKYRGKFAELKLTLDQMKHGDSIIIPRGTSLTIARVHIYRQNRKNEKQYRLSSRKHTDPEFMRIWKFEEGKEA